MIEHVYRRAAEARGVDAVIVATDDERIARVVEQFGGTVRMTAATHRTGTDRVAEVAAALTCDVIVNVQVDLPLLEPAMLTELIQPLVGGGGVTMSTLCTAADESDYGNPNVVKVVLDLHGDALYFSRSPIPFFRGGPPEGGPRRTNGIGAAAADVEAAFTRSVYKHIGLYGYRRDFLMTLAGLPQTPLERAESLEQLRALEHGYRIRAIETRHSTIEVDTPGDLERVRRHVEERAHAAVDSAEARA